MPSEVSFGELLFISASLLANIISLINCFYDRRLRKNVWEPDKSWKPGTLSHTLTLILSHSFTLSFPHSRHAEQLSFSCLCSRDTLSLSHSLTRSISHSLTLNMLNNFCFHVYAQKSLSHFHTLTLSHSHTFTLFQCLIQSLLTCWTSFVFMSRLKSRCL